MELLARAQADNPLEVYYDVLDALHTTNDDDVCHALLCLQAGSNVFDAAMSLLPACMPSLTFAVLLRVRKGRDMLFSQSLKIVVAKLNPAAEPVPSLQLLQASIEFVSPFVAEVGVPCAAADALLAECADVGWWEAAVSAHAAWSAAVACHLVETVPPVVGGMRRNCVAFILHTIVVATYAPEGVCASQSLRLLTLLHRCGFTVDDAVARLTVLAMRARRGLPLDSDAEEEDSDEEGVPLASRTELSWPGPGAAVAVAVAMLFASPLLPSVYLPLAWLQICVTCVPWLLQLPSPVPSVPGSPQVLAVRLLRSACAAVLPGSNYINDISSPELSPEVQLTRCVVSFMVSCPAKASRTSCLQAFEAYAATFHVRARFWLLCASIRGCPFDTVTGLLLNMLRRDLLLTLPRPPFDDATALTILYELLADVKDFSLHAVVGRHELHMGILTFYRALLLKEKIVLQQSGQAATGCWQPAELQRMRQGYILPLADAVHGVQRAPTVSVSSATLVDGAANDSDDMTSKLLLEAAVEPVLELMAEPPKL